MPPKEHSRTFTKALFVLINPQSHPKRASLGEWTCCFPWAHTVEYHTEWKRMHYSTAGPHKQCGTNWNRHKSHTRYDLYMWCSNRQSTCGNTARIIIVTGWWGQWGTRVGNFLAVFYFLIWVVGTWFIHFVTIYYAIHLRFVHIPICVIQAFPLKILF